MAKKANISVSQTLSKGWELTQKNLQLMVLAALVVEVGPSLLRDYVFDRADLLAFLIGIYTFVAGMGFIKLGLKVVRGKKAELADLFKDFSSLINYFIASIVYGLMVAVGLILLIIPGIYLALKYAFTMAIVIDKNVSVSAAMKKSASMTKGQMTNLFLLALVLMVLNILGTIPMGLGLLITSPISMLAYLYLYGKLS